MADEVSRVREMSVFDPDCVSRSVLEHATGRWGGLVLAALLDGPRRFAELRADVAGISDRMLAQTVKQLEGDGLISRTPHAVVPPRVDYELTELGRPIAVRIGELIDTIYEQLPGIVAHARRTAPGE